jgi:YbbR domain-containing protein
MMTPKTVAHVVFRNIEWKLLSLILAMLVWVAIYREPIIFSVLAAPVQFKNAPKDLEISSDFTESVDIETRGPAGLLRNLSEKRVAVMLDFNTVRSPGERTFTIERRNTNLPSGVEIVRVVPSQLRFIFEQRIVRQVRVDPQFSGVLPKGLHIVSTVAIPPELAIIGPESKVHKVTVLHTDPVDLNDMSEDKTMRVTAYLPNSQLRFKDSPEVTVKVSVAK